MALLCCQVPDVRASGEGEVGRPFLQNFAVRDYHAHNQNWAATQDARGVLYFGNKTAVLEYDGVSWRKIHVGETTYIRGLVCDPVTDEIYVGGVDELGLLKTGADGTKAFVSLRDRLPEDAREFGDIRRAHATPAGIFFVAGEQVMRWRDGRFTVWKLPNSSRLQSHCVAGRLYLQERSLGLLRLEGEAFAPASADPLFRRETVTLLLTRSSSEDGTLLVGTQESGLFTLGADGAAVPWSTDVDGTLKGQQIRRGLRLADGSLALATAGAGLILLREDGRFLGRVDESVGLQTDVILDLFTDREGGLWLGLNSGVTRAEVTPALTVFDAASGLKRTTARDVLRFQGRLLAATTSGVFALRPAEPASGGRLARFERLPGLEGKFWSLCAHETGGLLAGSEAGIYHQAGAAADGDAPTPTLVSNAPTLALRRSRRDPDRVFAGGGDGTLRALRFAGGKWTDEGVVARINDEIRTLVETASGEIWLGTPLHGIYRVRLDGPGFPGAATVTQFFQTHGLPAEQRWTRVVEWNHGDLLVATQAGLYRFDDPAQTFQPVTDYGPRFADGSFMIAATAEDAAGDLWMSGRNANGIWLDQELGHASRGQDGAPAGWGTLPYKVADRIGEIEKFYPDTEDDGAGGGVVWIGGTDGLVRVEARRLPKPGSDAGFATLIRQASSTASAGSDAGPRPVPGSGGVLPHARNSLRFQFAADTYALGARVRYQTRLEGPESGQWSDWAERASAEYPNLPEGGYVFRVRARDVDGRAGREATLAFRILPPWQRTAWAFAAYALLTGTAVFARVRWRLRNFRLKHARLENLIGARTGELRAREADLLRAKEAADLANRAKSAFLANMSHELRTPLNAILGYTQILLKDDTLSEKNRERLTVVGKSGGHLLAMINEVLDLAKIEAGKLTLNPLVFPLEPLLDDVCAAFRPRAAEKGLEFRCERAPGLPRCVNTDVGKLRQVLFNLLGNAVKFTARGSVVLHVTATAEGRVRFEVADTGMGIVESELRDIFRAFHQASDPGLAAQGAGLGLAISQQIAELLGGVLRVESTPERGSRFWFELNLPEAGGEGAVPAGAASGIPAVLLPTGFRGPRRRLLIVDDAEHNRVVLRDLLDPLGFEVEEVSDGETCLARCAQPPLPDALLLDLRMPGVDGFAVARALRGSELRRGLKIIAVSASVFEADRQRALDAGCDDFLPKPFTEAQLLAALGRALALEWEHPAASGPTAEPGAAPVDAKPEIPPVEEIDALLELSQRGDILKIKRRLAALRTAGDGRYASFVGTLEPFVAGYQMHRIRDQLLTLKAHGNGHAAAAH